MHLPRLLHRHPPVARLLRYASVSAISSVTSLLVLGLLVGVLGADAILANLVATAVGTVPSFTLNRRWVWSGGGARSTRAALVPYCALSFAGLVLSTGAVRLASALSASAGRLPHTLAVLGANVAAYGSLWVLQYLLCDRLLFRRGPDHPARAEFPAGAQPRHRPATATADMVVACPDEGRRAGAAREVLTR